MLPETRWVVEGTDKYGDPFMFPDQAGTEGQTEKEAEKVAFAVNRRGGRVRVRQQVWNGPASQYDYADRQPRRFPAELDVPGIDNNPLRAVRP